MSSVVAFFATASWLTWCFWGLCCLLTLTSACLHLSFALIIGGVLFCVCGRLTERSLGLVIPTYHLQLLKFLLHTQEVSSPGPGDVRAWSLLSLRRLFVHLPLRSEFHGLRSGLLHLLLHDFSLLDLFSWSPTK